MLMLTGDALLVYSVVSQQKAVYAGHREIMRGLNNRNARIVPPPGWRFFRGVSVSFS